VSFTHFCTLTTAIFAISLHVATAQNSCIDSVSITTQPVQCNTFRNGQLEITAVHGGTPPYYYSIDGETFTTRTVFDLLWPGVYTVTVYDTLGCVYYTTAEIGEPPVLEVDLVTNKDLVAIGESFVLQATVSPPDAHIEFVRWRPTDLFDDTFTYTHEIQAIGESTTFAIEVVDTNGCTARNQVTVDVLKPSVYAPNIISVGSNQEAYFTLFTDEYVRQINFLNIYSRNGSLVFQRNNFPPNDPLLGWNGRQNIKKPQIGVYTWMAEIQYLDGTAHLIYGSLTVVR
jgi:hypothetical protein